MPEQQQTLTIQQAIDLGVQHHTAGRLPQAETIYQQILQRSPKQPIALHLLGVIAHQVGKNDTAVDLITKALAIKPDYAEAHNNLGNALRDLGKLDEALTSYRKALAIKPRFAMAHNNLGRALCKLGRLEEALASYQKAVGINPDFSEAHNYLGNALQELGKLGEAVTSYGKALAIRPDYVEAHNNLGAALHDLGNLDEAVSSYHKALAIRPDFSMAHNNLGNTLQELGQLDEAVSSYHKALAIKPDYAEALNDLALALHKLGQLDEAVASYHKALAIKPDAANTHFNLGNTLEELNKPSLVFECHRRAVALDPQNDLFWAGLASSLETLSFASVDDNLYQNLFHMLERPTVRPSYVILPIIKVLRHHPGFSQILELTGPGNSEIGIDYRDAAEKLSLVHLFLRILELCPISDLETERMLTVLRRAMIEETMAGRMDDNGLPFSAALALQCFTNEYVFSESDEEKEAVCQLQKKIETLVKKERDVPPSLVVTLGAYRPLYCFSWAQELSKREWTDNVKKLITRQITEPREELFLRDRVPCITPIQNSISQLVRAQYEENPYPRWIKTNIIDKSRTIGAVLQGIPLRLNIEDYVSPKHPEILVAGCGTGQHALDTASRFSNAHILAVDLSLKSLSYAQRKTKELGFSNIEYVQGDITELDKLERRFDLIECAGVLVCIGDPLAGWRILVDLLRLGGLMKIGLYSEIARQDIVRGRTLIAEKGYSTSPEDIRRCRQDFIAMAEDGNPTIAKICNRMDFFCLSECRDLLFHVQEHRFTLPRIEAALKSLNLKFLGFEMKNQRVMRRFKEFHPNCSALTSLSLWHEFELDNPDTFKGMYQFWCQKL